MDRDIGHEKGRLRWSLSVLTLPMSPSVLSIPDRVYQIEDIPQEFPRPARGADRRIDSRKELAIPDDAPVILYTGNLEKYQGIGLAIEAAAQVHNEAPEARFVIVGGGPDEVEADQGRSARLSALSIPLFSQGQDRSPTCRYTIRYGRHSPLPTAERNQHTP